MPSPEKPSQSNGKVSTKDFYNALLETNKQMAEMERRILDKLDNVPKRGEFDTLHEQFEAHKDKDKKMDILLGLGTIIGGVIGAIFGQKQI